MAYLSLKFSEEVNVPRLEGAASIAPFNIFVSGTSFCCNNIRSALHKGPFRLAALFDRTMPSMETSLAP